ncbi:latent-transforming growth factor beta-binding protein 2 isoform X3 [Ammospiza caudacuta]|uniref:latent-transforming growth factor beta-binding protein 2 isoform X3 n=1 Tax=Ammospiza caudacuta TaxID=2857398 RepID=UPI0027394FCD|nr:latent-transforming growth factor beta-binding protein 2 isoform X3 [Ammospiza caudacuta]
MRGAAASLLPLTFAVLLGFSRCRPDSAARLEPGAGGAARLRSRGAALGAAGTANGLSPASRSPPPSRPLPAALHVDRGSAAAAGSPNGADGRRQRPDRGLPAPRGQAGDAGLGPGAGQRNRQDSSRQRQGGGLKARVVPRAKEPSGRGRMAGIQSRIGSPVSPQHTVSSRTVRRYPANNGQLTSNALPNGNGHEQSRPGPHAVSQEHTLSAKGANLTEKIRKIKIVFTPTICKQTCQSGRCYNSCEKGDTTTLYSQGGQDHDPKSGFRIYFCQIPCLNGGRCVGRDECWCPSNSTGKFCHLPAPSLEKKQGGRGPKTPTDSSMRHSTYTLPLSNQLASLNPSLVNVHINHPPEAIVQIHQVARVRGDAEASEENSVEAVLVPQLSAVPWYTYSHGNGNSIATESRQQQQRAPGLLGRCFREALHGQCTNPLPGLTKLEDCCGSVGLFWGMDQCLACPPRPAHPVIENGQVECPQGYKRLNRSHCQDINECLMQGLCKDAECMNTRGSFRCTCKPGSMLDPSRSHCVSDKAVSMEQGLCYRSAAGGVCTLPLPHRITQQICCCSRVGKGWGDSCQECPMPGSEAFKEICPAGHGYTYSSSDIRLSMRKAETDELPVSLEGQGENSNWTLDWTARRQQLQDSLRGSIQEAFLYPGTSARQGEISPAVQGTADAIAEPAVRRAEEEEFWHGPRQPGPTPTWDAAAPTQVPAGVSGCASSPLSCGAGACVLTPEGYSCLCHPGYTLDPSRLHCIDEDECLKDPCAGKGRCINSVGSYFCLCYSGYTLAVSAGKQSCEDQDECEQPSICRGQQCINTPGSYHCQCKEGFAMGPRGQCEDVNECMDPSSCPSGRCVNTLGSYQCVSCGAGYRPRNGRCIDVDECLVEGTCAHGQCVNLDGSFLCSCYRGYELAPDGKSCQDIDECTARVPCPSGLCLNTEGSYSCMSCDTGYAVSRDGSMCEDLDECKDPAVQCLGGECRNTPGSYECHCQTGFELINGTICKDVNECLNSEICSPNGECLNSQGSYFCICAPGFSNVAGGVSCQDVDECADKSLCSQGQCLNTEGSYRCLCENGFKHSPETDDCVDVDECKEYGDAICGTWRCQNSLGSYRCIMGCQPGFHWTPLGDCIDIDECANETLCGSHGFCENSDGSFRCLCDRGYESSPSGHYCIDVNECELMVAVCGTALCENVEGSFLCLCPSDHEEYDTEAGQCKPRAAVESSDTRAAHVSDSAERKQCYYHISDMRLCDSVLAKNITKEECCCTVGAAWGDNCETYPCPIPGTVEYQEICPLGKGYIPQEDLLSGKVSFTDMDECEIFGSEFCRNGQCLNTVPGYKCFCRTGYFYDSSRLECVDQDECQNEVYCINGECLNTEGSYHCFCSLPLVLDATGNRCVNFSSRADTVEEYEIHLDVCWQTVADYICQDLLHGQQTTYTECCCRLGEAWGQNCALCPHRSSADFAFLCNGASEDSERGGELRERPRYEYGPGLEDPHYGLPSPYYNYLESEYGSPEASFPRRVPSSEFRGSPLHHGPVRSPPRYLPGQTGLYEGFEGLQAEECGILNGCENGRCVRVPEGYTCDCFDGFQLDMTRMACVDINECEEVGNPEPLCRGGTCENTEGSYRCQCLPGYVALARSHHCVPQTAQNPAAA